MTSRERSPSRIGKLIQALAEGKKDFTSIEIAETLWLAMQIEPAAVPQEEETQPESSSSSSDSDDREIDFEPELPPVEIPEPTPRANLTAPTPQVGVLPPQTLPVWLADPAMLTDSLAIIRALRPLLQKIDVGVGKRLDEAATVDTIARTQLCLPVLAPQQDSWFDIMLVVDQSSSMVIWQRLVKDVVRILRRYGAFRDVRVFDLVVDPDAPKPEDRVLLVSNPRRPGHRPSELIDQQGRRIAIVLSDCAGKYWWQGTLVPMLQDWSTTMPTVVWQMLPPWMWKRTALGRGTAAALSNDFPGAANQRLKVQIQETLQEPDEPQAANSPLRLPIVTSQVRDLGRWSRMLAGDRREVIPGFLLSQQNGAIPRSQTYEEIAREQAQRHAVSTSDEAFQAAFDEALENLARERAERFLELASPEAQRLIMLLAAAPVITLPVVRLIRDAMLYETRSDPSPIAEVFLSGLLQRLSDQDDQELAKTLAEEHAQAQTDAQNLAQLAETEIPLVQLEAHELVQYDFAPRVRGILLEFLPAVDTIEVVNSVSAAVERRWNQVTDGQDFRAFLTNPNLETPEELLGLRSFANITADILEPLGGDYARFAQDLRQGTTLPDDGLGETDPNDFPLEEIEYEVAEYLNFPPLESFTVTDAQFEDEEAIFPPSLQTEEFTIITLDPESSRPNLETFEFTIATLTRGSEPNEWVVERQQADASRLIEQLPGDIPLEMVAIPGGTFIMGSPRNEPERNADRESPQHEVTVQPFFMGRYPVTQTQWRVVAAMPQVKRELAHEPSRFKGGNHPVEQVSWSDVVEFCARLSVYTSCQYRLPTEAEWEYACRAGTTTPFHFGDMITIKVANYNGSAYAGGPEGERRGKTTPVDHFGLANGFGLSDMHGNVWEWCQDVWHGNYEGAPTDGSAWIEGGTSSWRVRRGGSWTGNPSNCRSASRLNVNAAPRYGTLGFRVVCSAPRT